MSDNTSGTDPKPEGDIRLKGMEKAIADIEAVVKAMQERNNQKPQDKDQPDSKPPVADPEKQALQQELAKMKEEHRQEWLTRLPKKLQEKYKNASLDVIKSLAAELSTGAIQLPSREELEAAGSKQKYSDRTGSYNAKKGTWE